MDWNGDGKVDWKDYALHETATSNNNDFSGGDSSGCLTLILVGLIVYGILNWIAGMIY